MSHNGPPRAVFDCMVFFQATARPTGPAARLFIDFVESRRLVLYVSDAIIEEVRDLLGRPRIRAKNLTITDASVVEFINRVRQVAKRIDPVPASFALARDPDDEPYLNLAIATSADYLVTRDNDMLDLMRDAAFCAQFQAWPNWSTVRMVSEAGQWETGIDVLRRFRHNKWGNPH